MPAEAQKDRKMGLFDTVVLDEARACSSCGATIDAVQTKSFSSALREYRVGDIVAESPMLTGVVWEDLLLSGRLERRP